MIQVLWCFVALVALCRSAPLRGWDSWDGFGTFSTEETILEQARILSSFVESGGFEYIIIDEGWAENDHQWLLDEYGRPVPNPVLFPSTASTGSFLPLSTALNKMGLELGLWHIKGIPKLAVDLNLPIKGTNGQYTARDIAITNKSCAWHKDVFYVNMSHPAGPAYYNSLAENFAAWGVGYVKFDCVFGERDFAMNELSGMASSLLAAYQDANGTSIAYSVSPGVNATPTLAEPILQYVSSYRITDDLWDVWGPKDPQSFDNITVVDCTYALKNFSSLVGRTGFNGGLAYPDGGEMPFGLIPTSKGKRPSSFDDREVRYIYSLWSISKSLFILGGDLSRLSAHLSQLMSNELLTAMSTEADPPQVVNFTEPSASGIGLSIWTSVYSPIPSAFFLGIFPFALNSGNHTPVSISINTTLLPLSASVGNYSLIDVFTNQPNGSLKFTQPVVDFACLTNDATVYLVLPSSSSL